MEHFTKGVRKHKHKFAFFTAGASGSGKTTNREQFLKDFKIKSSYIYLNPDELSNKNMVLPLAYQFADEGYSLYLDVTSRNKTDIQKFLEYLKSKDYDIYFAIVYASLPTVLDRVSKRTEQPVPDRVVREIYNHFKRNAKSYMENPNIDKLYLYNNEHTFRLIYKKEEDTITCLTPESNFYFNISQFCN